jgi:hypothetical protein
VWGGAKPVACMDKDGKGRLASAVDEGQMELVDDPDPNTGYDCDLSKTIQHDFSQEDQDMEGVAKRAGEDPDLITHKKAETLGACACSKN